MQIRRFADQNSWLGEDVEGISIDARIRVIFISPIQKTVTAVAIDDGVAATAIDGVGCIDDDGVEECKASYVSADHRSQY